MTMRLRSRLGAIIGIGTLALISATFLAHAGEAMKVYSSPTCGCCAAWVRHVEDAGFTVEVEHLGMADLNAQKEAAGLTPKHASCHTGLIDGYAIEGHVPAAEIKRLLTEKPDAIGLSVPGMPADAPGMGSGDTPYEVLLVKENGSSEVFARYPR
ncbi:hypothetical protein FP2506_02485 [Fulvimarina pelagi HTCC2506]|uniref:Metal-binding protein n=2 Tax=Fulvimarina pelagi TaxID=217511 RepID=Q0FYC3_9HYPH|nr:DUF411 domain-containing protein [Fulvimarina pelagi]EAU40072.1 hypothetical protein FP2506_02485 [Fulvimarina pelagi HTCC2506]BAT31111.1 hypothetical protein [Fulvimarina pelagi]